MCLLFYHGIPVAGGAQLAASLAVVWASLTLLLPLLLLLLLVLESLSAGGGEESCFAAGEEPVGARR